jgi:hypothetical protein
MTERDVSRRVRVLHFQPDVQIFPLANKDRLAPEDEGYFMDDECVVYFNHSISADGALRKAVIAWAVPPGVPKPHPYPDADKQHDRRGPAQHEDPSPPRNFSDQGGQAAPRWPRRWQDGEQCRCPGWGGLDGLGGLESARSGAFAARWRSFSTSAHSFFHGGSASGSLAKALPRTPAKSGSCCQGEKSVSVHFPCMSLAKSELTGFLPNCQQASYCFQA